MPKYKKLALSPSGDIINRLTGTLDRSKKPLEIRGNRVYKEGRLYGYLGKQTKLQQKLSALLDKRRQKRRERALRKQGIIPSTTTQTIQVTEKPSKKSSKSVPTKDVVDDVIKENKKATKTTKIEEDEADLFNEPESDTKVKHPVIEDLTKKYEEDKNEEYEIELSEEESKRIEDEIGLTKPKPISEESLLLITDINKWSRFIETDEPILPNYKKLKQEESNFARSVNERVKAEQITAEKGDEFKQRWKDATTDKERDKVWEDLKADDPEEGFSYDPEVQTLNAKQTVVIE